jgi:hypothetical protein
MNGGVYIEGRRPRSKKEIKEAIKEKPDLVVVDNTSIMGGYSGPVTELRQFGDKVYCDEPRCTEGIYEVKWHKGKTVCIYPQGRPVHWILVSARSLVSVAFTRKGEKVTVT